MISLLDRKFFRDLLHIRWRIVALVLIIASGTGIFFGVRLALSNLLTTQQELLDRTHFADIEVQLLPEDRDNLPDLSLIPEVDWVESRLVFPGFIELADARPLTTLMIFQDRPQLKLNQLEVLEGRLFEPGKHEVVVDRALADFHGYRPGDTIFVEVGRKTFERTISGVVMSPEFLVTSSNPEYVVAEPGSLGIVWSELAELRQSLGFTMVNSLLIRLKPGIDPDRGLRVVAEGTRRLNVERIVPMAESYSTKQVRMEINAFGIYTPAIITTLLVLAVAMGIVSFRRFALEKKRELAVLLSIGMGRWALLGSLIRVGAVLGIVGGFMGLGLGWLLGGSIAGTYAQAMKLPMVIRTFEWDLALQTVTLGLLIGAVAIFVSFLPLFRRMPRFLLTEEVRVSDKNPVNLSRWPLLLRFGLKDLWRQRELGLAAILAMGGSIGVAISYGLAMTSNFGTVGESFQRDHWTYAVDFRYPLYEDEAERLLTEAGVEQMQPYFRSNTELRHGENYAVGILAGHTEGRLHRQRPSEGRNPASSGEAMVSQDLLRTLNARIGDSLVLEKGNETLTVRIVGATNDIFLQQVVVPLQDAQRLAQSEEKVSGYYVFGNTGLRERLTIANDVVARITDREQLYGSLMLQMREKMGMVYTIIVFSIIVSLLIVTTLIHLSIAERHGEYATLLSLGFGGNRLRTIIFCMVAVQLFIALLISVPAGIAIVHFLNSKMGEAWYAVEAHYRIKDFILPMCFSLVIAPLVTLFGVRSVMRINIPTYLRGRAI